MSSSSPVMVKAPHVAVVKAALELGVKMARGDDGRDGHGRGMRQ